MTMWVCLKHVGITDWVSARVKMAVKTLASWSAHALSARFGNLPGPATMSMLTCLRVLLTLAMESKITQSSRTAGALMRGSVLLASKKVSKAFSSLGRLGSLVFPL